MTKRTAAPSPRAGEEDYPILAHSLRLGDRLYGFVLIRFGVAVLIVAAAALAKHAVGINELPAGGLSLLAVGLCLCNVVTFFIVSPYRGLTHYTEATDRFLHNVLIFTIAVDFIGLTIALWLVGGAQSPFQAFFIFHVIIASIMLPASIAYANALFGYGLFSFLVIGSWLEWFPAYYPSGAVPCGGALDIRYVFTVLVVQALLILLTVLLLTHLMNLLRAGEQLILDRNQQLDRLSQQRRDFLHIALHNLRSPLAAVSMHLHNLAGGYGGELANQQQEWIARSQTRLEELNAFLNDLEYLATLESGELEAGAERVEVTDMLQELVQENTDLAQRRQHTLELDIHEDLPAARGIPRLLREAVVNYITNAIKYTPPGGHIEVRAFPRNGWVRIEVRDNGPGISPADQQRLFHEFVRIQRGDGEPRVPGSGLGLFIVRRIAEVHGGRAGLQSEPGKGSTFTLEVPQYQDA